MEAQRCLRAREIVDDSLLVDDLNDTDITEALSGSDTEIDSAPIGLRYESDSADEWWERFDQPALWDAWDHHIADAEGALHAHTVMPAAALALHLPSIFLSLKCRPCATRSGTIRPVGHADGWCQPASR